jgi:hypothetical protein
MGLNIQVNEIVQTAYLAAGMVLIGSPSELILGQKAFGAFDSEGSPDRNERLDEIDETED